MSNFLKRVVDAINVANVANVSIVLNKYSNYIVALLILIIIYQLYLATFVRENFGGASGSTASSENPRDDREDDASVSGTSCAQFTSCSECTDAKINGTNAGCFWNPTCKKCGSFKDKGYSASCDAKKDPTVKCSSDKGDSDPLPQTPGGDTSSPAPYDGTSLSGGLGVPLPYNDFDGAKSVVGGAAGSENGCPVCPKLTLLKGPTYTMAEV